MDGEMNVNDQILENARNIGQLTTNVMGLTRDFEHEKETRKEVQENLKAVLSAVQNLGEKISEISSVKDKLVDVLSAQSGIRHDVENIKQAQQGMPILAEKFNASSVIMATIDTRIQAIETRHIKQDGAAGAIRFITHILWAVFGAAISGMVVYHFVGAGVKG